MYKVSLSWRQIDPTSSTSSGDVKFVAGLWTLVWDPTVELSGVTSFMVLWADFSAQRCFYFILRPQTEAEIPLPCLHASVLVDGGVVIRSGWSWCSGNDERGHVRGFGLRRPLSCTCSETCPTFQSRVWSFVFTLIDCVITTPTFPAFISCFFHLTFLSAIWPVCGHTHVSHLHTWLTEWFISG